MDDESQPDSISVGSVPGDLRVTDNLMVPSGVYLQTEARSSLSAGIQSSAVRLRYNDDDTVSVVLDGDTQSYVYRFSPIDGASGRAADEDAEPGFWESLGLAEDFDPQSVLEGDDRVHFVGEHAGGDNLVFLAQVAPDDAYFVMSALADLDIGDSDLRLDRHAFFIVGEETNNAAGNLSGAARYSGTAYAVRTEANNSVRDTLSGTASLEANFTTNRVRMDIALQSSVGDDASFAAEPWSGEGVNMGGSSFWMQLLGDGLNRGEAKGRFYGPNAANAAGVFEGEYGDSSRIDGVFGTTRQ
ncbi:transferrin-binding protein-like solute binding protein [Fodinicurvata sp. EGI_FJ10296]|uniref:transferrin-binding protein-like solute binding protein n=1 Tax=Fodinicurvata sp. EGI_FJ10296 TaxID=3231908 RepID=UPI003451EAF5